MKAIILAAGVGSRLLPHTEKIPKCLLRVGEHTILDYQISALKSCGVDDIIIVVGHYGNKIREHLETPVTFIENPDYATTNSSYSLWLAKDFLSDGFIYLNSDLIFHPDMLKILLDSPHQDAIIVEDVTKGNEDMHNAKMDSGRILEMKKNLPKRFTSRKVVGPAKFGPIGAKKVIERLDELVSSGDKSRWAYEVFANVAKKYPFMGVDNTGYFWAEIDTADDLVEVSQNIPADFFDFLDIPPTAKPLADISHISIGENPIVYMNHLLNSDFSPFISHIPDADKKIKKVLQLNKELFWERVNSLKIKNPRPANIHEALYQKITAAEKKLQKEYNVRGISTKKDFETVAEKTLLLCPNKKERGLFIKDSSAEKILRELPPTNMITSLGYTYVSTLLAKEGSLNVLSLTRNTEGKQWQQKYKKRVSKLTNRDFEEREICYLIVDTSRYAQAFEQSKQEQKPWNISHSKEAGIITCFVNQENAFLKTPLLLSVLVFMHYFYETAYAGQYYALSASKNPEQVGQEFINSIQNHSDKLTFFYSNVYSENIFWKKSLWLFRETFHIEETEFFMSTIGRGEYCQSDGVQQSIVSLNLIDHLWNINFIDSRVGIGTFKYDTVYYLYHFRGTLWQEIFNVLAGLNEKDMDKAIGDDLGVGDTSFTKKMLGKKIGHQI